MNLPQERVIFYLFIALSFILIIAYRRGFRKNREISRKVLDVLLKLFDASDQTVTNIGGTIGYHFSITPSKKSVFTIVRATVTLLPRHALLYYPFSRFFRKFDRMYITLESEKLSKAPCLMVIETGFKNISGNRFDDGNMKIKKLTKNNMEYQFYTEDMEGRKFIENLINSLSKKPLIKQLEIVPEKKSANIFIVPDLDGFSPQIQSLIQQLINYLNNMDNVGRKTPV